MIPAERSVIECPRNAGSGFSRRLTSYGDAATWRHADAVRIYHGGRTSNWKRKKLVQTSLRVNVRSIFLRSEGVNWKTKI